MQDGMLANYLEQAVAADTNVEARIAKEPFDFRDLTRAGRFTFLREHSVQVSLPATNEELHALAQLTKE